MPPKEYFHIVLGYDHEEVEQIMEAAGAQAALQNPEDEPGDDQEVDSQNENNPEEDGESSDSGMSTTTQQKQQMQDYATMFGSPSPGGWGGPGGGMAMGFSPGMLTPGVADSAKISKQVKSKSKGAKYGQGGYMKEGAGLASNREDIQINEKAFRILLENGGPGSGNFGHSGVPGQVGGSGSGGSVKTEKGLAQGPDGPKSVRGTEADHKDANGNWTAARTKLHDKIVADHFAGHEAHGAPALVRMMGGGPASGKSTLLESGAVSNDRNFVEIDPDAIKGKLPEYQALLAINDKQAAAYVHEESSHLAKRVVSEGIAPNNSLSIDGTGDTSYENLERKVKGLQAKGARVEAEYVTVPTQVAVDRSNARGEKTGRFVPEETVKMIHAKVSQILPEAVKHNLFDSVRLWDTTTKVPTLVMSQKDGHTTIHDGELWKSFMAKGKQ